MLQRIRLLTGISVFWLPLSMLLDGVNTLVLPIQLSGLASQNYRATILGLITFVGLLAGALVQPVAGLFSDRLLPFLGRNRFIGVGLALSLAALFFFASSRSVIAIFMSYLAIQVSASIAQAGQQALIPDLVEGSQRGLASGLKGFMDLAGAMLGFVVLGQLLGADRLLLAVGVIAATLVITYLLAILLTPEDRPNKSMVTRDSAIPLREIFRFDLVRQAPFFRLLAARFFFLLGVYGIGRFLLLFVAERLALPPDQAAGQAGNLLAGLALITVLASPITGWLADRIGRVPLMLAGAALSAAGALLLIWSGSANQILLFGGILSLGSAAFSSGSWTLVADLVPKGESARFFGLANFSIAGAAALAGLFGPVMDWVEQLFSGQGFTALFLMTALIFVVSALPLKQILIEEKNDVRKRNKNKRKGRSDATGLAIISVPADHTSVEEDQNSQGRTAQL